MSETKFTPAPWSVEFFSDMSQVHVYSTEHDYTLHHKKKFFGTELAQVDIANAHLIACAPKMYAMLEKLSSQLTDINAHAAVNEIEALLAKARGEK